MGRLLTYGRIFLIVVNVLVFLIGLSLFIFGFILRFPDCALKNYYGYTLANLQKSLFDLGYFNTVIEIKLADIVGNLHVALIVTGLLLMLICGSGFLGALIKIKCLLLIYTITVFILVTGQVLFLGLFYWKPNTIKTPIKESLNSSIRTDYAGLNGTNVVSIGWNFINQKFSCCGIDSYYDFKQATKWIHSANQLTPYSCCVTLPNSTTTSCAKSPLSSVENNFSTGCFGVIWDLVIGNVAITASVISICLVMQITFFLTALCMYGDDGKSSGKVRPSNYELTTNGKVKPGNYEATTSGDDKPSSYEHTTSGKDEPSNYERTHKTNEIV